MQGLLVTYCLILGACVGSFLNVVAERSTNGEATPFWKGRSHCPACGATLTALDMVPVLNWFYLGGKCRHCKARVSFRYPLTELLGGLTAGLPVLAFGWAPAKWAVAFGAGALLLLIALCDWDTMEIPDLFTILLLLPAVGAVWAFPGLSFPARLIGAACISLPLLGVNFAVPGAFGLGDVQLAAVCGFLLGWQQALVGFFLALLLAGAQAAWLLGTGRAGRGQQAHMPFGPALCAGFWLALLWGRPLLDWYLGFFPG